MIDTKSSLILIVDDNISNLQVLGALLTQKGYEIAVAVDADKALEFLENDYPDLILLDIMMPGTDGYELCQKIKSIESLSEIPVLFLTALTDSEDIVKGFDAGAVDYISKPFNNAELLARIKTHVGLKKAKDELKVLRGTLPICVRCRKIKDEDGYWQIVEEYIESHTDLLFSHGLCDGCSNELYGKYDWYKKEKE
ncbi:MAG: response regulator [Spirochaetaceae bacterium]|jgi:DNA-binding response OmpR family regulator|nr:response regulator [Spirochaetaceae bacterium]